MGNSLSRRRTPEDLIAMVNAAENERTREKVALEIVAFIQDNPSQEIFLKNRSVLALIKKGLVDRANVSEGDYERELISGVISNITINNPTAQNVFATPQVAEALIKMANEAEDYHVRGTIALAIDNITHNNPAAQNVFATPQASEALIKMANVAEGDYERRHISRVIAYITRDNPAVQALFVTPQAAGALIKMANEATNDYARESISVVISNITYNNPEAQNLFATPQLAATLIKMANETEDDYARVSIATALAHITHNNPEAQTLFATPQAAAALIKMANEATNDFARESVALAIESITHDNQETQALFATPQAAEALVNMSNAAEEDWARRWIYTAIANITRNNHEARILFTQPQARELLQELKRAVERCRTENPSLPNLENIEDLLFRLLTEDLEERGGIASVCERSLPLIRAFTENPNHLKWANEIAGYFLQDCVNQPESGLSQTYACLAIIQAGTMEEKLRAADHLRFIRVIEYYISSLPKDQKIGSEVEVEAANALSREVCRRLVASGITQPFLGISGEIAYEGAIESWLTEEKIEAAFKLVLEAIKEKIESRIDILCNDPRAGIVFSAEVAEVIKSHQKQKEFLGNIMNSKMIEEGGERDDDLREIISELAEEDRAPFMEMYTRLINEDMETLNTMWKGLEIKQNNEIATKVKALIVKSLEEGPGASPSDAVAAAAERQQSASAAEDLRAI